MKNYPTGETRTHSSIWGRAYGSGEGVEEDPEQAVHWWCLAAEQGNETAKDVIEELEKSSELTQKTAQIIKFPKQKKMAPSEGFFSCYRRSKFRLKRF